MGSPPVPLAHPFDDGSAAVLERSVAETGKTLGHAFGWPFPKAGSQRIADALTSYLRSLGGEIYTGIRVRSVEEVPRTRTVLFDVTLRQLLEIAGEHFPERYRRALERYRYGPGVFKVDFALGGPIPWQAEVCKRAATIHLGGTLDEISAGEATVWRGEHPERPFVLLAQQSLFDECHLPLPCSLARVRGRLSTTAQSQASFRE